LLQAEQDSRNELLHGPRASGESLVIEDRHDEIEIMYDETEDKASDAVGTSDGQNEHHSHQSSAEDSDLADGEAEDALDDDMMDKISSSPSIDDGMYPSWTALIYHCR
jgi:hypothetical protein